MFRIDAADISYALGVNEKGELQTLYWGKRLRPGDPFRRLTRKEAHLPSICRSTRRPRNSQVGEAGLLSFRI
jgi:hypothetical protein